MGYAKSYVGDTLATGVVMQTIDTITSVIPGVTVKSDLAGLIQANVAEFWYNLAPSVGDATPGDAFSNASLAQSGSKKASILLERALHMDEHVPYVAIETISADILNDRIAKGSIAMANALGKKFITDLVALAQAKEFTNGLSFVDAIAEGMGTFNAGSSTKLDGVTSDGQGGNPAAFSNADNGIQATTIVVGDTGRAKLLQDDDFKRLFNGEGQYPALLGSIFGLQVVYSQHFTGEGFMLLNPEGVAYPYSLNTLRVVESENFNGVRVQGEVAYPVASEASILPIDSMAMVFTEGEAA